MENQTTTPPADILTPEDTLEPTPSVSAPVAAAVEAPAAITAPASPSEEPVYANLKDDLFRKVFWISAAVMVAILLLVAAAYGLQRLRKRASANPTQVTTQVVKIKNGTDFSGATPLLAT